MAWRIGFILAALILPGSLPAQQDLARLDSSGAIAAFRARLQDADTALLARLADSLNAADHTPASALRLGLVLLRKGQPSGAEQSLNWAVQRDWDNPDAWFALGEARERLSHDGSFAKAAPLMGDGAGYIGGASAAWFRVLALDPSRTDAALALASLYGRRGFTDDPTRLLPLLQLAARHNRDTATYRNLLQTELDLEDYPAAGATWHEYADAGGKGAMSALVPDDREDTTRLAISHELPRPTRDVFLLQARVSFQVAAYDSTEVALARYAAAGGDPAVIAFERSRVQFALGQPLVGAPEYYDAARLARDSAALALLRDDLAFVADSEELAVWDTVGAAHRAVWLRQFWQSRDVEDGRPLGSRLAEHRRREVYALAHYRLPPKAYSRPYEWTLNAAREGGGLREGLNDPYADDHLTDRIRRIRLTFRGPFDDRGLVFLRHGEPDQRVTGPGLAHWYTESWRYLETDGPRVVHFAGPDDLPPRMYLITAPATGMAACELDAWYCARAGMQAVWKDDLDRYQDIRKRQKVRKVAEEVLRTDDNDLVYPTPMNGIVQIYGVAGGLLGVFAVPSGELADTVGHPAPLRYRLSASTEPGPAAQVEELRRFEPGMELPEGAWIQGLVVLRVPPGVYQATLAVSDTADRHGAVFRLPAVEVPAFGSRRLVMSDLILGDEESELVWHHLGTPIGINPTNAYRQGTSAELYYQVDGQVPGRQYRTRIEVRKGNDRPDASLRFTETATSPRAWYKRSMGLARVRPGSYRLILTVTDTVTGEELVREQRLNVR